jgi:AmiR/NasT family two-component response regulator
MNRNGRVKVVVAEDDFLVSRNITRALEKAGYELVGKASNGVEAVEMVCTLCPDIVLMDIEMPELDGLEASRRIQERCPTPVVVLTAYESKELLDKASEVGVGAYLVKPPKASEIERAVTIAMARHDDLMTIMDALRQKEVLVRELQEALSKVRTLEGLIPICSWCKKVRDDEGYWQQVEIYISKHTKADFTHGICPDCYKKVYSEFRREDADETKDED